MMYDQINEREDSVEIFLESSGIVSADIVLAPAMHPGR